MCRISVTVQYSLHNGTCPNRNKKSGKSLTDGGESLYHLRTGRRFRVREGNPV
jgi:hypothetical protein